jgi:hypothetical protein
MKKMIWIIPLMILILLGCGSDYKKYYEQVHDKLLVEQVAPLHDELLTALNEAMDSTPPDDAANKSKYDQIATRIDEIMGEISKQKPPEEFKNPHAKLVAYLDEFKSADANAQKAAAGDQAAGKLAREAFKSKMVVCPKCGSENYLDRYSYAECFNCKSELTGGYENLGLTDKLKIIEDEFYGKKMILDNK